MNIEMLTVVSVIEKHYAKASVFQKNMPIVVC